MRYEDYKVEDMTFTTKEDWTEEEMKEFLDTCPECKDNEGTIKALNDLLCSINQGTVKVTQYFSINKSSAKSFAKNHEYVGYSESYLHEGLWVWLDGDKHWINSKWNITDALADMKNLKRRFNVISDKYKKKEKDFLTKKRSTEYIEKNESQILASRRAMAWLNGIRLEVPTKITKDDCLTNDKLSQYTPETKGFYGSNYRYHNEYGELTFFEQPVTEEEANHISEVITEAARKVSLIIDRCNVELQEIQEKYREMKGE